MATVITEVAVPAPGVMLAGAKLTETPSGAPVAESATGFAKGPAPVAATCTV